jgi:hypothetical protein
MKQLSLILTVICILAACSKNSSPRMCHTTDICVIHDLTDSFDLQPAIEPILSLYNFQEDKDRAASFRLVLITDKQLNPAEEIHLEEGTITERQNINEEIDYREQLVYSFYDAVRTSFTDFQKRYAHSSSLGHSECFATISSELNRLASNKASQRTLIVFSDLQENEDIFSCYSKQGRYLFGTYPAKVAALLQKRTPLPNNLRDVTVYFVFNPKDRDQDRHFSEMVHIYRELLGERGARVVVQATNKSYEP